MSEESNPQADQPKQQLTLHVIFYYFTLREVFFFFFFNVQALGDLPFQAVSLLRKVG